MRTGKYAHIIDKLPRLMKEEPARQEKLAAVKFSILANQTEINWQDIEEHLRIVQAEYAIISDLLLQAAGSRRYASVFARVHRWLRIVKNAFHEQESDITLLLDANNQLLVDQYEVEVTSSIKLSSGDSVRVQWEPYSKVMDRDQLREWAMRRGLERSLALPWQTVNAITKDALLRGLPEPDGVVAHAVPKIVWSQK